MKYPTTQIVVLTAVLLCLHDAATAETCGDGSVGDGVCPGGACCSRFGFCGAAPEFCSGGGGDGDDGVVVPCGNGVRGNGICANDGHCCSPYGYCDNTSTHCRVVPTGSSGTDGIANGTCGRGSVGNGSCADGTCCSPLGECGTTPEHCKETTPVDSLKLEDDPCRSPLDLKCDAGTSLCPAGSDWFDCDPRQEFRDRGCDACTAHGGRYCEAADGRRVCSSPAIAALAPITCLGDGGGTAYTSTCDTAAPVDDKDGGLSAGGIAGIVLAVFVLAAAGGWGAKSLCESPGSSSDENDDKPSSTGFGTEDSLTPSPDSNRHGAVAGNLPADQQAAAAPATHGVDPPAGYLPRYKDQVQHVTSGPTSSAGVPTANHIVDAENPPPLVDVIALESTSKIDKEYIWRTSSLDST